MSQNIDEAASTEKQESLLADKMSQIDLCKIDQLNASADVGGSRDTTKTVGLLSYLEEGLVENKNDVEVEGGNLNLSLQSVKSFEDLDLKPNLLKGVYEMGFKVPSKIQETVLPILLADPPQNVIVESQSGTGKRIAFLLAMLSGVNPDLKYPQILCLSSTYEIAIQTGEVAAHMAKFCPEIEIRYAVRGEDIMRNAKITEHVVIGTPGKVLDWGLKFKVFDLRKITVFVLVEADVMIATQGHQDQCIRIHKMLSKQCQMMFFSTTYEQEAMNFAKMIVSKPLIIRLKREEKGLDVDFRKSDDQLETGAEGGGSKETSKQVSLFLRFLEERLVENETDIEIQGGNPNLPLQSVKSFEDLNLKPNLLKGVYEMGFKVPSIIQETVLPNLLADPPQNVIVQSQSGTGKRTAFVLAMLSRVNPDLKYPQVLCLSPTIELALQTDNVSAQMAKFSREIKIRCAFGVTRNIKITEHVVIGTPERIFDLGLKFRAFDLNKIIVFVLDRPDVMLSTQGHRNQCIRIRKKLSKECQMMFFSATYEQEVMNFAENNLDIDFYKSDDQLKAGADYGGFKEIPKQLTLLQAYLGKGLVENKNDIEILSGNPNLPLQSVKSFEDLNLRANLLKGVHEMGFKAPSKLQETVLPILLANPPQNVIVQSQCDTGKTAAFVLAMLSRVNPYLKYPHVLCVSSTTVLAREIGEIAVEMTKYCTEIEIVRDINHHRSLHRWKRLGTSPHNPLRFFQRDEYLTDHVIISTPSILLDWPPYLDLSKITVFVLDQAGAMIPEPLCDRCSSFLKKLSKNCQKMIFSTSCGSKIMNFAETIDPKPLIINLKLWGKSLENIKQYYVICHNLHQKYNAVTKISDPVGAGQVIIFCNTNAAANWLHENMKKNHYKVAVLTEGLSVKERSRVSRDFRKGCQKVLIATNVLSRGIDVGQATIVVNFDLPVDAKGRADYQTYRHRIGRTGRLDKDGIAINLVDSTNAMQNCQNIEKYFNCKMNYRTLKEK